MTGKDANLNIGVFFQIETYLHDFHDDLIFSFFILESIEENIATKACPFDFTESFITPSKSQKIYFSSILIRVFKNLLVLLFKSSITSTNPCPRSICKLGTKFLTRFFLYEYGVLA